MFFRMILHQARYKWTVTLLLLLVMTALVSLYVYLDNSTRFSSRSMQLIMKNMGHNLLILPKNANPIDTYLCTTQQLLFPEEVTTQMAKQMQLASRYCIPESLVDLRYPGSEEHLIYLFTRRQRMRPRFRYYSATDSLFISPDGVLNNAYPDNWLRHYSSADWGIGSAKFINYVLHKDLGYGAFDAYQWDPKKDSLSDLIAFRRIVKGFIDNDIPLLLLVMTEAHFNVII